MRSGGQSIATEYHLLPYIFARTSLGKKNDIELVGYAGVPINAVARRFVEVERLRLYHDFGYRFKAGFGYGGAGFADQPWIHKPFLGVSFCGLEVWPQAIVKNGKWSWQLQLRISRTIR